MKIFIKDNTVWIGEINEQFLTACRIVERIYLKHSKIPVITSGNDGKHDPASCHYKNLGWDFRIWGINDPTTVEDEMEICAIEIRHDLQAIDFHYDVIYKNVQADGTIGHKDHMHIEYDKNKI